MSYEHLFQRYGSPSDEADIRLTGYLLRPDKLKEYQIKRNDETAARLSSGFQVRRSEHDAISGAA